MNLPIRWRLTAWYGAVLALILLAFGAGVYLMMRHTLLARIDATLTDELNEVEEDVKESSDVEALKTKLQDRLLHHERYDFQVLAEDGAPVVGAHRLADSGLPHPGTPPTLDASVAESYAGDGGDRLRVVSRQSRGPVGRLIIQAASSLADDDRELQELLDVLLFAGPVVLLAALGAGYLLASRALRPVQRMSLAADEITAHRLDRRIAVVNPGDELGRLSQTLNAMIARLEGSFSDIRQFTADAAHELRTPLTVIRNEAEVALRAERTSADYRRALENVLEETERLTRLAEHLLDLCREDAGLQRVESSRLRFDELIHEVADHVAVVAQAKGLSLQLAKLDECFVLGQADRLRRVLYNLLDNAIKYTPDGGTIRVTCSSVDGKLEVTITDTGQGISPEHLPHVFNRFYRADAARNGEHNGSGLGLAICRAIVESHHGTISISSPQSGGTCVTMQFQDASATVD